MLRVLVRLVLVLAVCCFASADLASRLTDLQRELDPLTDKNARPALNGSMTFTEEVARSVIEYGPVVDLQYTVASISFPPNEKTRCNDLRTSIWVGANLPKHGKPLNRVLLTVVRVDNNLEANREGGFDRCKKEKQWKSFAGWPEALTIRLVNFNLDLIVPAVPDHDCYQRLVELPGAAPLPQRNIQVPRQVFVVSHNKRGERFPVTTKVVLLNQMRNPDFIFHDFALDEVPDFIEKHLGSDARKLVQSVQAAAYRVNLFRYTVLYHLGGVYMDSKIWTVRPLETFLPEIGQPSTFVWDLRKLGIQNSFLAFPKDDPLMGAAIQRVLANFRKKFYGARAVDVGGPGALLWAFKSLSAKVARTYSGWLSLENGVVQMVDSKGQPWIIFHNSEYRRFMSTISDCHYAALWKRKAVYYERSCDEVRQEEAKNARLRRK